MSAPKALILAKALARAGFAVVETGGGCRAYCLSGKTRHILITDDQGDSLPRADRPVLVGVYEGPWSSGADGQSEAVDQEWFDTIAEAIAFARGARE